MDSDAALLEQYARRRDAEAFAELVRRHAAMVFATARRVTGSVHDAEDVAQACFLDLARNAGGIRSSIAGYLHSAATHRACNVLRDATTRRKHEQARAESAPIASAAEVTWEQIVPYVDAAMAELEEELREPLIRHFLQGCTQVQVAADLGISQATVSRRLDAGIESLRAKLQKAGVVASVAGVTGVLAKPAEAIPPQLLASLGKLAITGIGPATASTAPLPGGTWLAAKAILVIILTAALIGGFIYLTGKPMTNTTTGPQPPKRAAIQGVPSREIDAPGWAEKYLRGLQILLEHRGESPTLDDLRVYSGEAFHLAHAAHWQWGYYHLFIPTDPLSNAAKAYGYQSRWVNSGLWFAQINALDSVQKQRLAEEFLQDIQTQIAAGRPVFMGGNYGECGCWRVITGYDRDRHQMCYVGGGQGSEWADYMDNKVRKFGFWDSQVRGACRPDIMGGWQSNAAFELLDKTGAPTARQRALTALSLAVSLFQPQEHKYGDSLTYLGKAAYQHWADDLRALDYPTVVQRPLPAGAEGWYHMANIGEQANCIIQGRQAAALFCRHAAEAIPEASSDLNRAAAAYLEEVAIAKDAFSAFLSPSTDTTADAWLSDPAKREGGAAAVEAMLQKETTAIATLEHALGLPH